MKPNKTISILLTLIILLETLIPSLQSIAYGVEELIEEVESQSEEVVESEIEESIDAVIEKGTKIGFSCFKLIRQVWIASQIRLRKRIKSSSRI